MKIIEQRVLRGPGLCCGRRCIQTRVDLGELARAVTSDFPGFDASLLSMFPAMREFEEALARGTLMAEVIGRVALELERLAGAPPAQAFASFMQGRQSQVTIIIAYQDEEIALTSIASAMAIVVALRAGQWRGAQPTRNGKPARLFHPARHLPPGTQEMRY
jgi:cyanophycin synthetase